MKNRRRTAASLAIAGVFAVAPVMAAPSANAANYCTILGYSAYVPQTSYCGGWLPGGGKQSGLRGAIDGAKSAAFTIAGELNG